MACDSKVMDSINRKNVELKQTFISLNDIQK